MGGGGAGLPSSEPAIAQLEVCPPRNLPPNVLAGLKIKPVGTLDPSETCKPVGTSNLCLAGTVMSPCF